jgi:hypothetical protein
VEGAVQGLRKIGRMAAIVLLVLAAPALFWEGLHSSAPAWPMLLAAGAMFGAIGLIATWFFPTS